MPRDNHDPSAQNWLHSNVSNDKTHLQLVYEMRLEQLYWFHPGWRLTQSTGTPFQGQCPPCVELHCPPVGTAGLLSHWRMLLCVSGTPPSHLHADVSETILRACSIWHSHIGWNSRGCYCGIAADGEHQHMAQVLWLMQVSLTLTSTYTCQRGWLLSIQFQNRWTRCIPIQLRESLEEVAWSFQAGLVQLFHVMSLTSYKQ